MALEYKDYYQILGVPRTATDDEVRKAFRKLARQHHPDVAKNKAHGENKFKEINEANEVLGDPEKRRKYDAMGPAWRDGGFRTSGAGNFGSAQSRGSGQRPGFEFAGTGFSDFFEQFFGSSGTRGGFGAGSGNERFSERGQDMEADLMVTLEEVMRGAVRPITLRRNVLCNRCSGSGIFRNQACSDCGGTGNVTKQENYKVKIPAGVKEGQKLRLAGQGEVGVGKGPAGDLYLRVRFAGHPDFRIEQNVLCVDVDVSPWEAALGTSVPVSTLDAPVNIRIPPGTQHGQKLRVRERGLPGTDGSKGDLLAVIHIRIPKSLSEKERLLFEELAKESRFNPREA